MKTLWPIPFVLCSVLTAGAIVVTAHSLTPAPTMLAATSGQQSAGGDSAAAPSLTGNWDMSWTGANGAQRQTTMQLKQDGAKLSGKLSGERGSASVTGSIEGNQVSLNVKLRKRQIAFTGTIDGSNRMSGTTAQGAQWTATREQGAS